MAADIAEAVIDHLSATCGESFDEQLPGVPKFFTDWVPNVPLPHVSIIEMGGNITRMTRTAEGIPSIEEGSLLITVVGSGDKQTVRRLADLVHAALTDPDLLIDRATLMFLRPANRGQFMPVAQPAPDSPTTFVNSFTVPFMLSRTS